MGHSSSSLKVAAHLDVVGQCDCPDTLTLSMSRSKGKEGRRLLGAFSFPSAGTGPGQHRTARRTAVRVGKLRKKDGSTPVRVEFLAGTSVVARREIPLADLLAGLKANKIGRRSALFFSIEGNQAEDSGAAQSNIAVFYSRRLLNELKPSQEEPAEEAEHQASLPEQAWEKHFSLYPKVDYSNPRLPLQFGKNVYPPFTDGERWRPPQTQPRQESLMSPEVIERDLGEGSRWRPPQVQPRQKRTPPPRVCTRLVGKTVASLTPDVTHSDRGDILGWKSPPAEPSQEEELSLQSFESLTSLTPEVIQCDLSEGQSWVTPEAQLRRRRREPNSSSSVGEREGVVLQPSMPSPSKYGKKPNTRGGGRGRWCGSCLVNNVLLCAQVMTFTLLVIHMSLEWF